MRSTIVLSTLLVGLTELAVLPRVAHASPSYPGLLQTDLNLGYTLGTNDCIICHTSNPGNINSATQPFAMAMRAAGLVLESPGSLQAALATLKANKTDSDCDGVPDIQQLIDGRDPNPPGEYLDGSGRTAPADPGCGADGGVTMTTIDSPQYGCAPGPGAAQVASGPLSWPGAAGLSAALALAALATRRRGHRRPRR
jgi:hypothetical protein